MVSAVYINIVGFNLQFCLVFFKWSISYILILKTISTKSKKKLSIFSFSLIFETITDKLLLNFCMNIMLLDDIRKGLKLTFLQNTTLEYKHVDLKRILNTHHNYWKIYSSLYYLISS